MEKYSLEILWIVLMYSLKWCFNVLKVENTKNFEFLVALNLKSEKCQNLGLENGF